MLIELVQVVFLPFMIVGAILFGLFGGETE
jgi:hypothetical protein